MKRCSCAVSKIQLSMAMLLLIRSLARVFEAMKDSMISTPIMVVDTSVWLFMFVNWWLCLALMIILYHEGVNKFIV